MSAAFHATASRCRVLKVAVGAVRVIVGGIVSAWQMVQVGVAATPSAPALPTPPVAPVAPLVPSGWITGV
ncbi:MAG: hypothetical protein DLM61_23070 [Pseudonocardiales bacterium]|nr:MAG: hypothetical protein DLM61_23070 [Pseudonocardiales bacterium]